MPTKYESYDSGSTGSTTVYDANKVFQTFTPSISHTAYSVKLNLWRLFSGTFNMKVSIYAVDGDSHPIDSALCSKVLDVSSVTTDSGNADQIEFIFTTNPVLSSGTEYAITAEEDSSSGSIRLFVERDDTSPTYTDGIGGYGSSGSWFTFVPDVDYHFEDWGEPSFKPPSDMVTIRRLVAAAANKIWYEDV